LPWRGPVCGSHCNHRCLHRFFIVCHRKNLAWFVRPMWRRREAMVWCGQHNGPEGHTTQGGKFEATLVSINASEERRIVSIIAWVIDRPRLGK
jgi:hypothetical protein